MPLYEIDFTGTIRINAEDKEDAEYLTRDFLARDIPSDVYPISIEDIRLTEVEI